MMILKYVTLLAAGLVLVGCGDKKDLTSSYATGSKPSPASLMSSPKLTDSPTVLAGQQAQELPKPDRNVAASSYLDLNNQAAGMSLSYIVTAKSPTPLSDEDKLNLLSPSYYIETVAFIR